MPLFVIDKLPLKVHPPKPASLDVPFFTKTTSSAKVPPFKAIPPAITFNFPAIFTSGPKVTTPVPDKLIFCVVFPNCVTLPIIKLPLEKPSDPTEMILPAANDDEPVLVLNRTPPLPLLLTSTLSLNSVFVPRWAT